MSNSGRDVAEALGRIQAGQQQPGDQQTVEHAMGGDLALLVHCLGDKGPITMVIGVKNLAHAAACIASPALGADQLGAARVVYEIVPISEASSVSNPFSPPGPPE